MESLSGPDLRQARERGLGVWARAASIRCALPRRPGAAAADSPSESCGLLVRDACPVRPDSEDASITGHGVQPPESSSSSSTNHRPRGIYLPNRPGFSGPGPTHGGSGARPGGRGPECVFANQSKLYHFLLLRFIKCLVVAASSGYGQCGCRDYLGTTSQ